MKVFVNFIHKPFAKHISYVRNAICKFTYH
jgi:hypothetical protein